MTQRDIHGIICQHQIYSPVEPPDGGDSANRTGIMALCGSQQDIDLMPIFFYKGLVRHPFQDRWNNPALTSRDQLVSYAAGLWKNHTALGKELEAFYSGPRINKDLLPPDVRNHLRLCAGLEGSRWGYLWLQAGILWSTKIAAKEEQNQIICMVIVAGGKYKEMYRKLHPNIRENLTEYWNGWRDQPEIGDALYRKLME